MDNSASLNRHRIVRTTSYPAWCTGCGWRATTRERGPALVEFRRHLYDLHRKWTSGKGGA